MTRANLFVKFGREKELVGSYMSSAFPEDVKEDLTYCLNKFNNYRAIKEYMMNEAYPNLEYEDGTWNVCYEYLLDYSSDEPVLKYRKVKNSESKAKFVLLT